MLGRSWLTAGDTIGFVAKTRSCAERRRFVLAAIASLGYVALNVVELGLPMRVASSGTRWSARCLREVAAPEALTLQARDRP